MIAAVRIGFNGKIEALIAAMRFLFVATHGMADKNVLIDSTAARPIYSRYGIDLIRRYLVSLTQGGEIERRKITTSRLKLVKELQP